MVSIDASVHSLRNSQFKRLNFKPYRVRNGMGFVIRESGLFSILSPYPIGIRKELHDTQFSPPETQKESPTLSSNINIY